MKVLWGDAAIAIRFGSLRVDDDENGSLKTASIGLEHMGAGDTDGARLAGRETEFREGVAIDQSLQMETVIG